MSAADDFLRDAGVVSQAPSQLSAAQQFIQDAQATPSGPNRPLQAPQPLSLMDRLLAKVPTGLVNNPAVAGARNFVTAAASPMVGGAQLIANALPDSTGVPQQYNSKIKEMQAQDVAAAKENPATSMANSFAGTMASPAQLAIGLRAAPAVTAGARAVQGGVIGGVTAASAPVEVGDSGKYWGPKAVQTAIGTAGGAVLAPILGYVGDKVMAKINAANFDPSKAAKDADEIISGALSESNQKLEDIPPDQLARLRQQTVDALSSGKKLDAAAAMRMQDFNAEGIQGTQGQITRDPMQFADEQTMKGISRPLSMTMEAGNKKVTQGIGQYGANALEAPAASAQLANALRSYDSGKASEVSAAYNAAKESTGSDLLAPTDQLMTDYRQVASDFEDKVPKAIQSKFERLGFQFSPVDADNLRKSINDHVGSDPVTNKALGKLRDSLNTAQQGFDAQGGPFAPAVKLARDRFAQQEAIPAIADAVNGNAGDNFIQKQVINGQTADVQKLAALLKEQAPEVFDQTRQQIGNYLGTKAFGENVAGDKPIAQESYNKALNALGTDKLNAFFEPQEVEQMRRLGRIGAYQQSNPAAAASNFSNSAGAFANLLRQGGGIPIVGKSLQFGGEKIGGYAAINPQVPVTANLTDQQRLMMSRVLTALTGAGGIALPGRVIGQ